MTYWEFRKKNRAIDNARSDGWAFHTVKRSAVKRRKIDMTPSTRATRKPVLEIIIKKLPY